jgi:hypothetical protein
MSRRPMLLLPAVLAGLLSVLLAIAVNIATLLPRWGDPFQVQRLRQFLTPLSSGPVPAGSPRP